MRLGCAGLRSRVWFRSRHQESCAPRVVRLEVSVLGKLLKGALLALVPLVLTGAAAAQPTNVRAWYAQGQVFVVWEFPAPPVNQTDTVEIYISAAAQVSVANMTRTGKLFFPEYTGSRLQALQPNARLQVPTPAGGTYRLGVNEGVFAYTPRQAGFGFFAVVDTGGVVVNAGNSASAAYGYDPINEPVGPQAQFDGFTAGGNPYRAYVIWADGSDAYDAARPDIPVLASSAKNGVPHVFTITRPVNALPAEPLSCLFAHHGGEGEYQLFRPGVAARANLSLELDDGIVVSPDDSIFVNAEGVLSRSNTAWFGYTPSLDPFFGGVRLQPPDDAVVVNFTQRRVHYILDWLLSARSPFVIDPNRVSIVGHSGGGRGTSHLSRLRPERFGAAVVYTPASDLSVEAAGRVNYLIGNWDQNLTSNLPDPSGRGAFLGVTDVVTMTTRLSATQRDFPLTRFYFGKRDDLEAAAWSPAQRAGIDALDASRKGFMIFWDEREHGVEKWDNETPDLNDGNPDPWPDVGQWIAPVKTRRSSGQYLVDTYRPTQSYPGFFNSDQDPVLAGRQLDPGPGDPSLGEPWGTWGGYFDWDTSTIVDLPNRWEATIFATGVSATSIDNAPVAEFVTDLAPRRPQQFNPAPGTPMTWYVRDLTSGLTVQTGVTAAESDGVVVVTGLRVPRDPSRVRLVICRTRVCDGDANGDGLVNFADITRVLASLGNNFAYCRGDGDTNGDASVNFADITTVLANLGSGC